jgi:hypothetical protein
MKAPKTEASAVGSASSAFTRIRDAAIADVEELKHRLELQDGPLERRALVRAVFAYIEAMTYALKQVALAEADAEAFSEAEDALLCERDYFLADSGKPRERPMNLPLKANVRFAFAMMGRPFGASYQADCSGAGWSRFCAALQIRHRLMHPKAPGDFEVSRAEVDCAWEAFQWFNTTILDALRASMEVLSTQIRDLRESVRSGLAPTRHNSDVEHGDEP